MHANVTYKLMLTFFLFEIFPFFSRQCFEAMQNENIDHMIVLESAGLFVCCVKYTRVPTDVRFFCTNHLPNSHTCIPADTSSHHDSLWVSVLRNSTCTCTFTCSFQLNRSFSISIQLRVHHNIAIGSDERLYFEHQIEITRSFHHFHGLCYLFDRCFDLHSIFFVFSSVTVFSERSMQTKIMSMSVMQNDIKETK